MTGPRAASFPFPVGETIEASISRSNPHELQVHAASARYRGGERVILVIRNTLAVAYQEVPQNP